jgi:hypothetical protein
MGLRFAGFVAHRAIPGTDKFLRVQSVHHGDSSGPLFWVVGVVFINGLLKLVRLTELSTSISILLPTVFRVPEADLCGLQHFLNAGTSAA